MRLSPKEIQAFRLANVISQMANGGLRGSFEAEVLQDVAAEQGGAFDSNRVQIPWGLMATRDMTVAGVSGSNYLVGQENGGPVDILRPWSVTARAGVTPLPGLKVDVRVPVTQAAIVGYWLANDTTSITEGQPTLGGFTLRPKIGAAFAQYSRLLQLQSEVEILLRRDMLRTAGTLLDQAVLAGSGASDQPTGLFNTAGTTSQSGTSLAWSGVLAMEEACANANGEPTAWIGTPTVRKLLKGRERATGLGFIWSDTGIGGTPAYATTVATAGTLACGPWSQIAVGLWGVGPEIAIDPYTGFKTGINAMRIMLPCDVAVLQPGAFAVAASIT